MAVRSNGPRLLLVLLILVSSSRKLALASVQPPLVINNNNNNDEWTTGTTAPCPQCSAAAPSPQQAAQLKIAAIKQQILSKLHLRDKPNITSPLPREVALEALRRTGKLPGEGYDEDSFEPDEDDSRDDYGSDYYAKTSEIIAFAEPGHSLNGHVLLDFYPLKEHSQRHLRVVAGTLWIQLRYAASLPKKLRPLLRDHQLTLYVFRVNNATAEPLPMELLSSYKIGAANVGWRRLEVGQAVQQWFAGGAHHRNKLTLLVDCVGCDSLLEMVLFHETTTEATASNSHHHRVNNPNQDHLSATMANATSTAHRIRHGNNNNHVNSHNNNDVIGLRPFLAIATEGAVDDHQRRSKRHPYVCEARVTQCCRQNLYVSFRDLHWDDWIIAPKGYYANFCTGNCDSLRRTPDSYASFHSHVIEEYRNRNPYASIHPCCAPTRLSAISLIYFDPDFNIISTILPRMVVEDCGCT